MVKDKLLARLELIGMQPKRSLGQNFLVSEHAIQKILGSLPKNFEGSIVEIGPGPGALTEGILEVGHHPILIELDRSIAAYWSSRGLEVLEQDALAMDFDRFGEKSYLISNLPYQISSSLVIELSIETKSFNAMTLMFQKEVAQRITAVPKTSQYGLLSVVAQSFWSIKKLADFSPQAFYPSPKVSSRVLIFKRLESRMGADQRKLYLKFLKACFHQKRKKLSNNLKGFRSGAYQKAVLNHLEPKGFTENVRAEEIPATIYLDLFDSVLGPEA